MSEHSPSEEPVKLVNRLANSTSPYVSKAETRPQEAYPDTK